VFVKVGLGEGDRHEFEHFVERHAEDGDDLLSIGEAALLTHWNARLYAPRFLEALSPEWGACHRPEDVAASRTEARKDFWRACETVGFPRRALESRPGIAAANPISAVLTTGRARCANASLFSPIIYIAST